MLSYESEDRRMKHKIIWRDDVWGGAYPACPKCGEPAYEPDHCFNCGIEFEQEDSEEAIK